MGTGLGAPVGLGEDDHIQGVRALFVKQWPLVEAGLDMPLHARLFEVVHREVVVSHLGAILAPGTSPSIGTSIRNSAVVFWRVPHEFSSRHGRLLLGE